MEPLVGHLCTSLTQLSLNHTDVWKGCDERFRVENDRKLKAPLALREELVYELRLDLGIHVVFQFLSVSSRLAASLGFRPGSDFILSL